MPGLDIWQVCLLYPETDTRDFHRTAFWSKTNPCGFFLLCAAQGETHAHNFSTG